MKKELAEKRKQQKLTEKPVHNLQAWIEKNCEFILKVRKQMTFEECEKILQEFPDRNLIVETLYEMNNYKPLASRYQTVYLTLRNWLRRNSGQADPAPSQVAMLPKKTQSRGWSCTYEEALSWLSKRNIPFFDLEKHFTIVRFADSDKKPEWRKK